MRRGLTICVTWATLMAATSAALTADPRREDGTDEWGERWSVSGMGCTEDPRLDGASEAGADNPLPPDQGTESG